MGRSSPLGFLVKSLILVCHQIFFSSNMKSYPGLLSARCRGTLAASVLASVVVATVVLDLNQPMAGKKFNKRSSSFTFSRK